jgi:hypothetical protein
VGDRPRAAALNRAVKKLYASAMFQDVAISLDTAPDGMVATISIGPAPMVRTVGITGVTEREDAALLPLLIAEPGRYVPPSEWFRDGVVLRSTLEKTAVLSRVVTLEATFTDGTKRRQDLAILPLAPDPQGAAPVLISDLPDDLREPYRMLAAVNGEAITVADLHQDRQEVADEYACGQKGFGPDYPEQLRRIRLQALNRLVDDRLIIQCYRREGGFFTDSYLDSEVKRALGQSFSVSSEALSRHLEESGTTMDEYRETLGEDAIIYYVDHPGPTTFPQSIFPKPPAAGSAPDPLQREMRIHEWLRTLRRTAYIGAVSSPAPQAAAQP